MQKMHEKLSLVVKRRMKEILRGNRFFFLAVAVVIFLNVQFDFYYIKTGSMEPELPVGTIVATDTNAQAKVGDIYAYRSGKNVVIHRIIAADEEGYTFKGDANPSTDAAKVTESQLVGKVVLKLTFLVPVLRWAGRT